MRATGVLRSNFSTSTWAFIDNEDRPHLAHEPGAAGDEDALVLVEGSDGADGGDKLFPLTLAGHALHPRQARGGEGLHPWQAGGGEGVHGP